MILIRCLFVCIGCVFLSGCTAVVLTAAGIAAGVGVDHTLSGYVNRTFAVPVNEVQDASLATLQRMEIQVTDSKPVADGWEINGIAANRRIVIELEALTPNTTRMNHAHECSCP